MAEPVMLPGGNSVQVAGESYYDENLNKVCGGRTEDGHNLECVARLVPEPDNPYDPNAVAVHIDGLKVGHLPREAARAFQPVVRRLNGSPACCAAVVRGGWNRSGRSGRDRGNYGVTLDLASARTCIAHIDQAGIPKPIEPRRGWLARLFDA